MVSPGRLSPLRVLVLAPHPYFVVRGTPIDLDLVLRVLSERGDTEVDVLVYGEGEPRSYPRVRILRGSPIKTEGYKAVG